MLVLRAGLHPLDRVREIVQLRGLLAQEEGQGQDAGMDQAARAIHRGCVAIPRESSCGAIYHGRTPARTMHAGTWASCCR